MVRQESEGPYLVATVILGFLSISKKSQASSYFEALNYLCLSNCQRDVMPSVQIRQRPRAFSRFHTGISDIPSSFEMKDEPAFKPLQENLDFFRVRTSWCPFHLRQQTQRPYYIRISEGSLLLRCLWKVSLLFSQSQGISSHLEMIWGTRSFPRVAVMKLVFLWT